MSTWSALYIFTDLKERGQEMVQRDDCTCNADKHGPGEPAGAQEKGSGKLATAAKIVRATTAIIVFGIPLITGTATLVGYGLYKAYKRITGTS
jgi:hypothetical protein